MSRKYVNLARTGAGREEFLTFWKSLASDTAASAEFRRAWSVSDCVLVGRFHDLRHKLAAKEFVYSLPHLAVAVLVAARCGEHSGVPFGRACAEAEMPERRLKAILRASAPDEVVAAFARVLPLLDRRVDVADAAWAAYRLAHPDLRESAMTEIAERFFMPATAHKE